MQIVYLLQIFVHYFKQFSRTIRADSGSCNRLPEFFKYQSTVSTNGDDISSFYFEAVGWIAE